GIRDRTVTGVQTCALPISARLLEKAPRDLALTLRFKNAAVPTVSWRVPKGADQVTFDVPIPHAHLWSLDDPFLYEVDAAVGDDQIGRASCRERVWRASGGV